MATFEFSGAISGSQNDSLFETLGAKIKVIGVGGGGGNAINYMVLLLLEFQITHKSC